MSKTFVPQDRSGYVDVTHWVRQRDKARRTCGYLWGACITLLVAICVMARWVPDPPVCAPAPDVMQLDPTTIRGAREAPAWL